VEWFKTLLIVLQVISALAVIVLVLLQQGKGADMGAALVQELLAVYLAPVDRLISCHTQLPFLLLYFLSALLVLPGLETRRKSVLEFSLVRWLQLLPLQHLPLLLKTLVSQLFPSNLVVFCRFLSPFLRV
jgi:hypothetical protein